MSEDNWVLDGCPENGPAVAMGDANSIHVVWPTLVPTPRPGGEPAMALFYARSSDGHRFSPRQRIPTEGFPRHPQIAIGPNGEFIVAWDEQAEGRRRVAVARGLFDANDTPRFSGRRSKTVNTRCTRSCHRSNRARLSPGRAGLPERR